MPNDDPDRERQVREWGFDVLPFGDASGEDQRMFSEGVSFLVAHTNIPAKIHGHTSTDRSTP